MAGPRREQPHCDGGGNGAALPGVPLLREERNGSSQIGLHGGASRGSTGQYNSLSDHGRNNILAAVGIAATCKRTPDVVVRV
ncbi:hypothetical protein OsI_36046 [Oryza sativa Indica Group]|uniref:Uncharacterized protein n=1 Tax=Oryza sativa subsp. indica TaxID=39946 RepID=B8BKE6_ORYSI|nr:hypothetical protein OsI_36046 [Oryza sativa Indica Group]